MEPDTVREAGLFEERVKVDLARYRVEAVVGDDEERSARLDSGVPDRLAQNPDAGVGVGQSGGSQVVVRAIAMLRVVGREKMNGKQVGTVGADDMGGRPRQNRVGGPLEARRAVPLVVKVDRNTCLAQRRQEARLGPGRVGIVARVECLRQVIVDGRVPLGLGPEEAAVVSPLRLAASKSVGTSDRLRSKLVGGVKRLSGRAVAQAVGENAVDPGRDAGDERRMGWMRHAWEDGLAAGGLRTLGSQRPDVGEGELRVVEMIGREAVDRYQHHVPNLGSGRERGHDKEKQRGQGTHAQKSRHSHEPHLVSRARLNGKDRARSSRSLRPDPLDDAPTSGPALIRFADDCAPTD